MEEAVRPEYNLLDSENKKILVFHKGRIHHTEGREEVMIFPAREKYRKFIETMKDNVIENEIVTQQIVREKEIVEKLKELFPEEEN